MGKNRMRKFAGKDKDREITYQLPSQANYTHLGENVFYLLPIKIYLDSEEQRQILKQHLSSPLSQVQLHSFTPDSSTLTPRQCREWGDTYGQSITVLLCNFSLFTHFPCSIMGSLQVSVLLTIFSCYSAGFSTGHSCFRKYPPAPL